MCTKLLFLKVAVGKQLGIGERSDWYIDLEQNSNGQHNGRTFIKLESIERPSKRRAYVLRFNKRVYKLT